VHDSGEEEEEEISIASDIIEVKGEFVATTGCLRKDRVSRYVGNSQSWVCNPWLACSKPNHSPVLVEKSKATHCAALVCVRKFSVQLAVCQPILLSAIKQTKGSL